MRRWAAAASLACAIASITACEIGSTGLTSTSDVVGTYRLQTVNGQTLPFTFPTIGVGSTVLTDDEFTLNSDRTYSESGHETVTDSLGVVSVQPGVDSGTFIVGAGTVTLFSTLGEGSVTALVSGSTLTLNIGGTITAVYGK